MHRGRNITVSYVVAKIETCSRSRALNGNARVSRLSQSHINRGDILFVNSQLEINRNGRVAFLSTDQPKGRNLLIENLILSLPLVLCISTVTVSYTRKGEKKSRIGRSLLGSNGKDLYLSCPFEVRDLSRCPSSSTACLLTVYTTQSPLFVETLEAAKVCGYLYNVESSLHSIFVIRLSHRGIRNRVRDSSQIVRKLIEIWPSLSKMFGQVRYSPSLKTRTFVRIC